jgi:hypothetical protein
MEEREDFLVIKPAPPDSQFRHYVKKLSGSRKGRDQSQIQKQLLTHHKRKPQNISFGNDREYKGPRIKV